MQRQAMLDRLQREPFDLLVIGGGATGCGAALDAASRGLKVALVERGDFASGTSSRSTKLIHGGVRYLEQAVKRLDPGQLQLVREALRERRVLLRNAPHLTGVLPLLTPLYRWHELPYYAAGLKLYDLLAGRANLRPSRPVTRRRALQLFPTLDPHGLRGGVVYYDGQFDDARMNLALALTAAEQGAAVANHVRVTALVERGGRLTGAVACDAYGQASFEVAARVVLNATGPYGDSIRRLDDPGVAPVLRVSTGTHLMLERRFAPLASGLLIPRTEDGRVIFVLPWHGHTLVGTTDDPASVVDCPRPSEGDIDYLLAHLRDILGVPVTRADVKASWTGLRPLVSQPEASSTAQLSRDHALFTSPSGLITITGGKWTTYRRMAAAAVDRALEQGGLTAGASRTESLALHGAARFDPLGHETLARDYGLEPDVAQHLNRAYGDQAGRVAALAAGGLGARLAPGHPYLEAEVRYARDHELAVTAQDVLRHRTRLAFVDEAAAETALPRVEELLHD